MVSSIQIRIRRGCGSNETNTVGLVLVTDCTGHWNDQGATKREVWKFSLGAGGC